MIKNQEFLAAFSKVAELGTVHAAAASLGLTQTGVTQRLKSLERELGMTLFLRSRQGMVLTDEGKILLQYEIAKKELDAQFLARLTGKERAEISLSVVGPTSAISTRIASDCEGLYSKYPFLRLQLRSTDKGNRVQEIKSGNADLAIVHPEQVPHEMDSKKLKPDQYLLVGSPRWRGRKLTDILANERVIDFDPEDHTTQDYLKVFGLPQPSRPAIYINENEALIRYFAAGIGFGTLTESVARPYLDAGKLITFNKGLASNEPFALVWYPRSNRSDYFDDLVRSIR